MDKMFWKATAIRAIKTMCQTAAALIGTNAAGILDVDWVAVLSASALAGILSVLTSVGTGLPEVKMAQSIYMDMPEPEDSYSDKVYTDEELAELRAELEALKEEGEKLSEEGDEDV